MDKSSVLRAEATVGLAFTPPPPVASSTKMSDFEDVEEGGKILDGEQRL